MLLAAVLACTVASFSEATYTTSCGESCQKSEYKTGCYGASASGKCDVSRLRYQSELLAMENLGSHRGRYSQDIATRVDFCALLASLLQGAVEPIPEYA